MTIKQQIDQDLKQAMLAGNKDLVTTLRGLKSAILYAEVAKGDREAGLSDDETIALLGKEAKKRQDSADLYEQGGNKEKATAERTEKEVIAQYLPAQVSDEDLLVMIDDAIAQTNATGMQAMGQVIGVVKARAGAAADGARIAQLVKEKLS